MTQSFARYFGSQALDVLGGIDGYVEMLWAQEEFTGGCYGGFFPTGVWTSYGQALRQPVGPIHWAGTETSPVWNGYMDGAVRSGERAAGEALAGLPPSQRRQPPQRTPKPERRRRHRRRRGRRHDPRPRFTG